jgi:HlyD family secretion protein
VRRLWLFLLLVACQPETSTVYSWHTVQPGTLELGIQESGEVVSESETVLRVPFDGKLTRLLPEGTILKAGQVLGSLDTSAQQLERDNARFSMQEADWDQRVAEMDRTLRLRKAEADRVQASLQVKLESLKLKQLKQERDQAALTRVAENLKALSQRQEILSLESRERNRLFELGYLSRQERDEARLQLEESRKEQQRLEAELQILREGPRPQDLERQALQVKKARSTQKQAQREAQIQVKVAEVVKKSASSRKQTYQNRLGYYQGLVARGQLRAPVPGTLIYGKLTAGDQEVPVKAGDSVKEGMAVVRLIDLQKPVVRLNLHEIDAPRVLPGQWAEIIPDAYPEVRLSGRVQRLLPIARQSLSNDALKLQGVTCEVRLEGPDPHLKPGMTAQVKIRFEQLQNVLTVPSQALWRKGNETFCLVNQEGRPVRRKVETGPSDALRTVIRTGLKAGDQVLRDPQPEDATDAH